MKKLLALLVLSVVVLGAGDAGAAEKAQKIKLGVDGGPHAEIAEVVKKIAAERGLEIELVEFSDFILPNAALADKEIDVNSFQHLPYMETMMKDRGYKLVSVGTTVLMPMAVYSKRLQSMDELKDGMTVSIPNDPSNGGRALLLLAYHGLIDLNPAAGILPTVADITKNESKLRFAELDAAQLPRTLEDTDLAVINTNYAVEAGMVPARDALFIETKESPYANIIAVREEDKDRPEFKILVECYNNDEVRKFIDERYKGALIAVW